MKKRPFIEPSTRKFISRMINLLIGILVLTVWSSMTFRLGYLGAQAEGGLGNLRYFTVLSNLLQGGVSLFCFFGFKVDRWKYASTTAITFTFLIVLLVLGPARGYGTMYAGANFWSHLVVPVLSIVDFLVFDREGSFTLRDSLFAVIPMLAYSVFYMGNIWLRGVENNDWYGFAKAGAPSAAVIFLGLLAVNEGIAMLLWLLRRASHAPEASKERPR